MILVINTTLAVWADEGEDTHTGVTWSESGVKHGCGFANEVVFLPIGMRVMRGVMDAWRDGDMNPVLDRRNHDLDEAGHPGKDSNP